MASVVIVLVEHVLTDPDDTSVIPVASPHLPAIALVRALSERWPIGYVTTAKREQANEWLKSAGAPSGTWTLTAPLDLQGDAILRLLGERRDRIEFVLTAQWAHLGKLVETGAPMLLYHPSKYALSDWRPPSSWSEESDT